MARGVVKFFKSEKGWGAISCDELPSGQDVWIHFSVIEGTGYRTLEAGDVVDFDYVPARQDSFTFRATRARRLKSGPAPTLRRTGTHVVIAPASTPETPMTPPAPPDGTVRPPIIRTNPGGQTSRCLHLSASTISDRSPILLRSVVGYRDGPERARLEPLSHWHWKRSTPGYFSPKVVTVQPVRR